VFELPVFRRNHELAAGGADIFCQMIRRLPYPTFSSNFGVSLSKVFETTAFIGPKAVEAVRL